jgi:hypothetical protein
MSNNTQKSPLAQREIIFLPPQPIKESHIVAIQEAYQELQKSGKDLSSKPGRKSGVQKTIFDVIGMQPSQPKSEYVYQSCGKLDSFIDEYRAANASN